MLRTMRYPLRPTAEQERVLDHWRALCCDLYNAALEHRRDAWQKGRRSVQLFDQYVELTDVRAADRELAAVPALVLRSALKRVDGAFSGFFRRCSTGEKPGYPRFRSRARYDGFGIGRAKVRTRRKNKRNGGVYVPKLGRVRFHAYRPLRGAVRDVELVRSAKGWWLCVVVDLGAPPEKEIVCRAVGIDLGLMSFVALSDGTTVPAPRLGKHAEGRIAEHQRVLARKKPGSRGREKQRRILARAYGRVSNARLDFHRKLVVMLFASYDFVAYEALNIREMVKQLGGGGRGKSIYDAGWGQFIVCLRAKAEEAGLWAVPVNPRGTSQRCSACGAIVQKDLRVRVHECACGLVLDRDVNAARNVLALGISAVQRPVAQAVEPPTGAREGSADHLPTNALGTSVAAEATGAREGSAEDVNATAGSSPARRPAARYRPSHGVTRSAS